MIYNTIGWSYYELGCYHLALDWCHKAIRKFESCSDVEYSKYSKILRSEEKLEKSSPRNNAEYAEILTNIGSIYYKTNEFNLAISHCTKSMDILKICDGEVIFCDHRETAASNYTIDNHYETIAANYEVFADIHHKNGNYALALEYYRKAREIFEKTALKVPICLQRSPHIFGRNKQRLQDSIRIAEEQTLIND